MAKSSDPIRTDFSLEYFTDDNGRERVKPVDIKAGEGLDAAIATATLQAHLDGKPLPMYAPTPAERPKGMPFKDAVEYYITNKEVGVNTKETYGCQLKHAQKFFREDRDARYIEQTDLMDFKEYVVANLNEGSREQVIRQVVAMLNFVKRNKNWGNPLTTKDAIPKKKKKKKKSQLQPAFSLDQLYVIFQNAKQYKTKTWGGKPWHSKYWLTIALPFLGCRITELAQINLASDLLQDQKSGVWFINIEETEDDDGILKQSVKNEPSLRKVPIHPALIKHGFLDFLHEQKKQGATRPFEKTWSVMEQTAPVFENAKPKKSQPVEEVRYHWGKRAINWASNEIAALRKSGADVGLKTVYNHSMRHTFAAEVSKLDIHLYKSEAAMGHDYGGSDSERYMALKENPALLSEQVYEPGLVNIAALLDKLWEEDSPTQSQDALQSI